jgi:single-stranded DNA-binding protein
MDLNMVVLAGTISADPEIREFDSGNRNVRFLVTTKSEKPRRRVDVVPVVMWASDVGEERFNEMTLALQKGKRVWVPGTIQRRFFEESGISRSKITVVGHEAITKEDE